MRRNGNALARSFMKASASWVLFLAACLGVAEPAKAPAGFLQVWIRASDNRLVAYPQATFVNAVQSAFPNSKDTSNVCSLSDITGSPFSTLDFLNAGDSIAFASDSGTVYLYPTMDFAGNQSYRPKADFVTLTPGTAVTFQIPGSTGGFPAATLGGLTAPALTQLSPIPSSVARTDSMVVTWAPVGDDSSRIETVLQFAAAGLPAVDRQIVCQWRDDGRGVIAGNMLVEWSSAALRHVQVTRYRTTRQDTGPGPVLYFLAAYDTVPAPVP